MLSLCTWRGDVQGNAERVEEQGRDQRGRGLAGALGGGPVHPGAAPLPLGRPVKKEKIVLSIRR